MLTFGLSLPPSMMSATPGCNPLLHFASLTTGSPPSQESRRFPRRGEQFPLSGDDEQLFWLDGQPKPDNENEMNWAIDYIVEPDYLKAMGIPLLRGRFFTPQDNEHSPLVVVVDEVFAQKYFPNQNPVGKRIHINRFTQLAEIVGRGRARQPVGVGYRRSAVAALWTLYPMHADAGRLCRHDSVRLVRDRAGRECFRGASGFDPSRQRADEQPASHLRRADDGLSYLRFGGHTAILNDFAGGLRGAGTFALLPWEFTASFLT